MTQQLVWLVTGCSSGFGSEFVSQILCRGDLVIATARNPSKIQLQHIEPSHLPNVRTLQLDVTSSQSSLDETIAKAVAVYGRVDVLVNNAGYIQTGSFEDLDYEDLLNQFETNVFGVIKVTKALLPHFRTRHAGTMVFISSRSGWYGDLFCSAYAGSKFALEGIVEGLRWETEPLGIKTLLVVPGRFRTRFLSSESGSVATLDNKRLEGSDYKNRYQEFLGNIAKEDGNQPGDTSKGVKAILDMVRKEGVAKDKEVPFRIPLGTDCYETVQEECEETLRGLKEWEGVIKGTDYDP